MVTLQARHLWRDSLAVNAHGDIALRLSKSDAALKDSVTGNGERRSRCVRKAGGPGSGQGGGGGGGGWGGWGGSHFGSCFLLFNTYRVLDGLERVFELNSTPLTYVKKIRTDV